MKQNKIKTILNWKFPVMIVTLLASVAYLSSCNDSSSGDAAAPTLTLSSSSTSNAPGQKVTTTVTVDAPEGGKTLTITVNGASSTALPNVDLAGATTKDVAIEYTIPADAVVGSTTIISFQASDKKDQQSVSKTFSVLITATPPKYIKDVTGNITTNTTWSADTIYRLVGFVRVGKDEHSGAGVTPTISATATLTIEAGTVIYGKVGTPGGTLIVQRGSKIIAIGTEDKPIVFTSEKSPGSRISGDWGGVVLCGKSANNLKGSVSTGTDGIEELEGAYGGFHGGGASPVLDDNSGTLKYVRVEYAGYPINPNQEINGITFGSIGSGTTLDHIQVTYANDDSYEWFGGTVNATHLVAYKGIDDDFDTDNGFSGQVQFGLGIRDKSIADQSGSNGFECDNDANGSSNTPITGAQFSNMTIIGGKATSGSTINLQFQNGAQIRRNAQQDVINSIITGYPNGIYIDNQLGTPGTIANATSGNLVLKNNILAGVEGWGANGFGSAATTDEQTVLGLSAAGSKHPNNPIGRVVAGGEGAFTNGVFAYSTSAGLGEKQINNTSPVLWFNGLNTIKAKWSDTGLSSTVFEPLNGTPTLLPTASSLLTSGASFDGFSGFEVVTYRGAFGSTDWTSGWVNWSPQLTDYSSSSN
ncbi:MAG TPA: Ig-like domain repeat protein [Cyclobacteriaceae bacterium]